MTAAPLTETKAAGPAHGIEQLDFILPGTWRTVLLGGGPTKMKRAVGEFVESVVGRADKLAKLRAELREQLFNVAQQATSVGAKQIHFASEFFGLPFPASLAITWPVFSIREVATATPAERADRLVGMIGEDSATVLEHPRLGIVRTVQHTAWKGRRDDNGDGSDDDDGTGAAEARVPALAADYWISLPDDGLVVIFSFSSPMVQIEGPLLDLFGGIVSTIRPRARAVH